MTAQELQDIIAAGLTCQHLSVEGDGRHWYATLVSSEFEGLRWGKKCTPTKCTLCP